MSNEKCIACIANDAQVAIDLEHTCELTRVSAASTAPVVGATCTCLAAGNQVAWEYVHHTNDCPVYKVGEAAKQWLLDHPRLKDSKIFTGADAWDRETVATLLIQYTAAASPAAPSQPAADKIWNACQEIVSRINMGEHNHPDLAHETALTCWLATIVAKHFETAPAAPQEDAEPLTFKNTKEAMEYAQRHGIPAVVPVSAPPSQPARDAARELQSQGLLWSNQANVELGGEPFDEEAQIEEVAAIISRHLPAAAETVGERDGQRYRDGIEDAAKATCVGCANTDKWGVATKIEGSTRWRHTKHDDPAWPCGAGDIRTLLHDKEKKDA